VGCKIAILDDYQRVALRMADWSSLPASCSVHVFDRPLRVVDEAASVLADFEIVCLLRERMPFPRELFERLPSLRFVAVTGPHNRTLDLAAAADHGVVVSHTHGGNGHHATIELTWALILATARNLAYEDRLMRAGGWQATIGMMVHGRTLGVLGLGRIGSGVAALGHAFGMKLIAWSPNMTPERASAAGARLVSRELLFAEADVVTVHMVLSDRTRDLIGAADLDRMPRHAVFVNTSRGPIVNEAALVRCLRERRIAGAGLDVYDQEPLPADHVFRKLDNVVLTPHLGYVSEETYKVFYGDTVENIRAYLAGEPVRRLV
jgi:D-3-phosphoglycerate dehydrogenase